MHFKSMKSFKSSFMGSVSLGATLTLISLSLSSVGVVVEGRILRNPLDIFTAPNGYQNQHFPWPMTWNRLRRKTSGHCEAGRQYVIRSERDFADYSDELECILAGGTAPTGVPQGPLKGSALSVGNDVLLIPVIVNLLWKGKLPHPLNCSGSLVHLGLNSQIGLPFFPGMFSVGPVSNFNVTYGPGEYVYEGSQALLVDYKPSLTRQLLKDCPEVLEEALGVKGESGKKIVKSVTDWALRQPSIFVRDYLRQVGVTKEGQLIFLGKSFIIDLYKGVADDDGEGDGRPQVVTGAFFTLISEDREAVPGAFYETPTNPLSESFDYRHPEMFGLLRRALPFDDMLQNPLLTSGNMLKWGSEYMRSLWLFLRELPSGSAEALRLISTFRRRFGYNY